MSAHNSDIYFNNGHLNDEGIALYVDALILNREGILSIEIHEHIQICHQCKEEAFALYAVMQKDNIIQNTVNHPCFDESRVDTTKKFMAGSFFKMAVVIILILSIGTLMYYITSHFHRSHVSYITVNHPLINKAKNIESQQNLKDTVIVAVQKDSPKLSNTRLASTLKKSALYESLIVSQYRNADIEVSFPPLNYSFHSKQDLVFKLNGDISASLVLIIFDNQGKKLIEINDISNKNIFITKKLFYGLYYWKLMKEDNVIQMGKFFVK
jgi:hypothetical protein